MLEMLKILTQGPLERDKEAAFFKAAASGSAPWRNAMAKVIPKVVRAIETKLIHSGEPDPRIGGAVAMPIFQSAPFTDRGEQNYHDLPSIRPTNTPTHVVLLS